MPRIVEITLPPAYTEDVAERVTALDQVISMRLQRGISLQPPGDVLTVAITDRRMPALLHMLAEMGLDRHPEVSITSTRPASILSSSSAEWITRDSSESSWEELEALLNKESGMTRNSMATLGLAGVIAAAGILSEALHLVIGAMLIAPGFQPIARIALGMVGTSAAWRRGLGDTLKGYLCLVAGAALAALLAQSFGLESRSGASSYLPPDSLLAYWQSTSAVSVLVSSAAAIAGAILVITDRSVLTAGAMVALALVPAAALVGMGLALLDLEMARTGLLRLLLEMGLVVAGSLLVFGWKRLRIQRRRMSM